MKTELLGLMAACALLGSTVAANASPYVVTLDQIGSNVVATGSGQLNVTGLSLVGTGVTQNPGVQANIASLTLSQTFGGTVYTGLSGPTSFGSGGPFGVSSSSGPPVAIVGNFTPTTMQILFVPTGYMSDSVLATSTDTWNNATLASLGLTPGTYVWTWGTGADQSFTLEIGQTPLPAALPLFATGLGGLGLLGWRRKRKSAAPIAAA
jgi:hypothetical protein